MRASFWNLSLKLLILVLALYSIIEMKNNIQTSFKSLFKERKNMAVEKIFTIMINFYEKFMSSSYHME